jgi:hypothetical protein
VKTLQPPLPIQLSQHSKKPFNAKKQSLFLPSLSKRMAFFKSNARWMTDLIQFDEDTHRRQLLE